MGAIQTGVLACCPRFLSCSAENNWRRAVEVVSSAHSDIAKHCFSQADPCTQVPVPSPQLSATQLPGGSPGNQASGLPSLSVCCPLPVFPLLLYCPMQKVVSATSLPGLMQASRLLLLHGFLMALTCHWFLPDLPKSILFLCQRVLPAFLPKVALVVLCLK